MATERHAMTFFCFLPAQQLVIVAVEEDVRKKTAWLPEHTRLKSRD